MPAKDAFNKTKKHPAKYIIDAFCRMPDSSTLCFLMPIPLRTGLFLLHITGIQNPAVHLPILSQAQSRLPGTLFLHHIPIRIHHKYISSLFLSTFALSILFSILLSKGCAGCSKHTLPLPHRLHKAQSILPAYCLAATLCAGSPASSAKIPIQ